MALDVVEHRVKDRMLNLEAEKGFEVFIGSDNIVRINIDGVCELRVLMAPGSKAKMQCAESQGGYAIRFAGPNK